MSILSIGISYTMASPQTNKKWGAKKLRTLQKAIVTCHTASVTNIDLVSFLDRGPCNNLELAPSLMPVPLIDLTIAAAKHEVLNFKIPQQAWREKVLVLCFQKI